MSLSRQFNIFACSAVLAAILSYCVADSKPLLGLLAIAVCGAGFWAATEERSLPRLVVNILVLIVIANAVIGTSWRGGSIVSDLSKFLVYIQLIKLFDRRSPRDDAHLLSLSVFIVIGAVLTSNVLGVGLFLLAYTPLAISAAMLLQLSGGQKTALAARPVGYPAHASTVTLGKAYRRSFRRTAGFAVTGTVAMASVAFLVTPRGMGKDLMGNFGQVRGSTVGFSDSIRLGASGFLSSSATPVLQMRMSDMQDRDVGYLLGTVYLRGYVREHYNRSKRTWEDAGRAQNVPEISRARTEPAAGPDNGKFQVEGPPTHPGAPQSVRPGPDGSKARFREHITLLHGVPASGYVFTTWRPILLQPDIEMSLTLSQRDLTFRKIGVKEPGPPFSYTVAWAFDAVESPADSRDVVSFNSERVTSLAQEILTGRGITLGPRPRAAPQTRAAAGALQSYLRQGYAYTTEMIAPDHDEDPIEMFLFRTRKGHCEYFASAMVALCQSVGIDARIVAGYLATEYSSVTGEYTVRESNAHAWVEVELEPGRWLTMDPSPPDAIARLHRPESGILGRLRHFYEALEFTWVNAVVTFDEKKRSGLVGSGDRWSEALHRISGAIGDLRRWTGLGSGERGGSGAGFYATIAAVAALAFWITLRFVRVRRRARPDGPAPAALDPGLAALLAQAGFFDRAMRALDRSGLGKPRFRPPLSHAAVLGAASTEVGDTLRSLSHLYYRVRFARTPLDPGESSAAEALADRLVALLPTLTASGVGPHEV